MSIASDWEKRGKRDPQNIHLNVFLAFRDGKTLCVSSNSIQYYKTKRSPLPIHVGGKKKSI